MMFYAQEACDSASQEETTASKASLCRVSLKFGAVLGLIVVLAFLIRIVLVSYGLPLLLYEDEPIYYNYALGFGLGHWNIGYFKKPGFFLYFYSAFYALAYLYTPGMNWSDYVAAFWRDPSLVAGVGRTISVLFAAGTIGLTGLLGKRFISVPVGLTAALWMAGNLTHLRVSPIVIADIPALFFVVAAAWFALKISETGRCRDYLLCAASIALAISFKYNVFSAAFLLMGHAVRQWREAVSGTSAQGRAVSGFQSRRILMMNAVRDRRLWLSLALAAVLFLLLNPMILRDFSMFQTHLNFEKRHMLVRTVHDASAVWRPMAAVPEIFLKILPRSLGWPIYLLGLGGMAVGFWRMRGKSLILLSFPVAFLLVVSQFQLINAKYLLPLTPFWLLFAAFALWEGGQWLYARLMASLKGEKIVVLHALPVALLTVVVCGLALPGWWESLAYMAVHRESDTRNLAHQAIQVRAREGDRFFLEPDTLTMDNRLFRTRLTITDFHGGDFQLVRKTSSLESAPMAMALKELHPRYILMNLGEAEKTRDARGQVFYRMPYASDYYEALQRQYHFSALFSPCPIRLSRREIVTRLRAKSFGGLYEAIQHHKGRRNRPGPFLLLLERNP